LNPQLKTFPIPIDQNLNFEGKKTSCQKSELGKTCNGRMMKHWASQDLSWTPIKPATRYHGYTFLFLGFSLLIIKTATQSLDVLSAQTLKTAPNQEETSEKSSGVRVGVSTSSPQTCNVSALGNNCERPRQTLAEQSAASALHDAAARNDHEELLRLIKGGMQKYVEEKSVT
jgi:hypothetical protein